MTKVLDRSAVAVSLGSLFLVYEREYRCGGSPPAIALKRGLRDVTGEMAEQCSTARRPWWSSLAANSWLSLAYRPHHQALLVAAVCWLALATFPCRAQVLEIGDGGKVSVYDGPAVFTAEGVTPLPHSALGKRPLRQATASPDRRVIEQAASAAELSPALVEAVAWQELRFKRGVVSRAGAVGEMQIMPTTATALGVNPLDIRQNYEAGASYLRSLMRRYDGDLELALAAYDAGPGAVDHYHGVPPFKETRAYVAAILDRLSQQVSGFEPGVSER